MNLEGHILNCTNAINTDTCDRALQDMVNYMLKESHPGGLVLNALYTKNILLISLSFTI